MEITYLILESHVGKFQAITVAHVCVKEGKTLNALLEIRNTQSAEGNYMVQCLPP